MALYNVILSSARSQINEMIAYLFYDATYLCAPRPTQSVHPLNVDAGSLTPANQQSIELMHKQNDVDIMALLSILLTQYSNGQTTVPKSGNIHLAWDFAQKPANHDRFINMLRVSPLVFQTILTLIEEHPVFTNSSHNGQTLVEQQLAVTLFRMERSGNGASVEDIA